jgi:peroxiredoxin
MKRFVFLLMILLLVLSAFSAPSAADRPPRPGELFPDLDLPMPKNAAEKTYLGLTGEGSFSLGQVKAQVVILEIFSMYCPYCQKEAPQVNELFRAIETNPDSKGKIKVLGIGAGNSPFEVGMFKKTYAIPFPLIADEDLIFHHALGGVRTPYFLAVVIEKDKTARVIFSELGSMSGAKSFLKKIIELAGLK